MSYGEIFAKDFRTERIDSKLADLELDEKLMIIDNVIDYLHQNFRDLSPQRKLMLQTINPRGKGSPARMGDDSTTEAENGDY